MKLSHIHAFIFSVIIIILIAGCSNSGSDISTAEPNLQDTATVADALRGAELYKQECFSCHGELEKGTEAGPPLLHKVYRPSHHGDVAFLMAVKRGVRQHHWLFGDMPPIEGLETADISDITAFIREKQKEAGLI